MKTAVIIAGGMGTRLRPLTYEIPKAMIPIQGKPLIVHTLEGLQYAGVDIVYVSLGVMADRIIRFLGDGSRFGVRVQYIVEEKPLGTAGWMNRVDKNNFQEDFLVINCDDLSDVDVQQMQREHKKNNAVVTMSLYEVDDPRTFGVVTVDDVRIIGFSEKPKTIEEAKSRFVSHGCYMFSPNIFGFVPKKEKIMFEYDIFPLLAELRQLYAHIHTGQWYTTNDFLQWEKAIKEWKGVL